MDKAVQRIGLKHGSGGRAMRQLIEDVFLRLASPVDYASPQAKQTRLNEYYKVVHHTVSGEQLRVSLQYLAHDLRAKADWLSEHLRADEWVTSREGYSWFNGYYDDDTDGQQADLQFAHFAYRWAM